MKQIALLSVVLALGLSACSGGSTPGGDPPPTGTTPPPKLPPGALGETFFLTGEIRNWPNAAGTIRAGYGAGFAQPLSSATLHDAKFSMTIPAAIPSTQAGTLGSCPYPELPINRTISAAPLNLMVAVMGLYLNSSPENIFYESDLAAPDQNYVVNFLYADQPGTVKGTLNCGTALGRQTRTISYNLSLSKGWNTVVSRFSVVDNVLKQGSAVAPEPPGAVFFKNFYAP